MKKNYLFLAAATTLFAACVQTDVVTDIPEPQQQAISFETFANKATRTDVETPVAATTALATHHDAYKVWAYKNTQNTTLVFYEEVVKASDNSYSSTQYWDKAATNYYFYAAAPAPLATTTTGSGLVFQETSTGTGESKVTTQESAYFTITNLTMLGTNFSPKDQTSALGSFIQRESEATPTESEGGATSSTPAQTTSGHDIDYMIATTPVGKTNGSFNNPVNFNFAHILSRLNITVKKAASNPEIELTELSIKNLKIQSDFNSSESELASRWPAVASGTAEAEYQNYEVTDYEITTNANYILECLLIPQTAAYENVALDGTVTTVTPATTEGGTPTITTSTITSATAPYIHIQYQINDETFDAYYNLAALFGADGTTGNTSATFSEAYQNTLNITISPVSIVFSTSGCAWETNNATTNPNID